MNLPLIEACAGSYASCAVAQRCGADRVELCGNLIIGGTTPSLSLFELVHRDIPVKVNVLIRPRFGDFLYDAMEVEEMCRDIARFRDAGANGVVIGALTPDGDLDMDRMKTMMACAGDMEVTLHRAFDMTRDPFLALEQAIDLGCKTILTSGQARTAQEGVALLAQLQERAAGRITLMAGSGVNSGNIRAIHEATGIRAFHATGKKTLDSAMRYRKSTVSMGLPGLSEYELWQTDAQEFSACAGIVHALEG